MSSGHKHSHDDLGILGWFARNHVAANLLMLFLLIGGLIAVKSIRTELFPTVDPHTITISVPFPGSTPYEVEDGITSRVEEAIIGIEGVKQITAIAQENMGSVTVELEDFADAIEALNDIKTAIDQIADFPPQQAEDPVITHTKPTPSVITLVLYGDVPELTLKQWAEKIKDELIREPDISLVNLKGDKDYEISIEISEETLRKYELTLEQVGAIISKWSINLPGGTVESRAGDILIRVQEKRYFGRDFENIVIRGLSDGSLLRLKDIATIYDGFRDENMITIYNGNPGILIEISRSEAQDTLKMERAVQKFVKRLTLPAGIHINTLENRTDILKSRMNLLVRNGLLGFSLVFLILLLFLDLKLAFWTSFGIPTSFLGGLLVVFLAGMSLNMVTLFALIIVLGIVVDDAIVTGESIFSEQESGEKGVDAVTHGVRAIRAPVTIGVLTTVAAFAPLAFTSGTLGQIMRPIPIFVISILLVSLLEAFLILPAHLSSPTRWSRGLLVWVRNKVTLMLTRFTKKILVPVLIVAIRWRYATLAIFIAILMCTLGLVRGGIIKFIFFPQVEGDLVSATLVMPVGTPFQTVEKYARHMHDSAQKVKQEFQRMSGNDEVFESVILVVGSSFSERSPMAAEGAGASSNHAELQIHLIDAANRTFSAKDVEQRLIEEIGVIPNADELSFQSSLVSSGEDINIQLAHEDVNVLSKAAAELKEKMGRMDGVIEIADTLKEGKLEYLFTLTSEGLAAGLTPNDIATQLRSAFYGYDVQRIQRGRSELKVMVRYPKAEREKLKNIYDFRVRLHDGSEIPISTVAKITQQRTYAQIKRVDGQRVVNVTADVDPTKTTPDQALAVILGQLIPELKKDYPDLRADIEGETKDRKDDMASLQRGMMIALLIIFVLLGAQLRSYIQPMIIMAIIPFGIVGALWGHVLLGFNLSFISIFGIVALSGVVINDSVVLIDYFNLRRAQGESISRSIINAVQRRLRPIILTTLTTSFGLLPIILEKSLQARFLVPMAISLACGLLFGSFLLLFLVPILINITEDLRKIVHRK